MENTEENRRLRRWAQIYADFTRDTGLTRLVCRAVRYADMDWRTPRYSNEFAYQGVSRSARPADAGQRSVRSWQILFYHLGILGGLGGSNLLLRPSASSAVYFSSCEFLANLFQDCFYNPRRIFYLICFTIPMRISICCLTNLTPIMACQLCSNARPTPVSPTCWPSAALPPPTSRRWLWRGNTQNESVPQRP